jgi:hypothetical protein
MTNHNITCDVVWQTGEKNIREYKLSPSYRIWPCNYFVLHCDDFDREESNNIVDPVIQKLQQQDPDWNNILKNKAETILKHNVFTNYAWTSGWNSDNPSPICLQCCSNRYQKGNE